MLLIIDNYDSFTFNIAMYFKELGEEVLIIKNDELSISEIAAISPQRLVISPGPCGPSDAGVSKRAVEHFSGKIPILGVCLGHQCIADVYGGVVVKAEQVIHGKVSKISHDGSRLYYGVPKCFESTRYHSLIVDGQSLPKDLIVRSWTEDNSGEKNEIMGIEHCELPIFGVQFHPESILSEFGHQIFKNFIAI